MLARPVSRGLGSLLVVVVQVVRWSARPLTAVGLARVDQEAEEQGHGQDTVLDCQVSACDCDRQVGKGKRCDALRVRCVLLRRMWRQSERR